MKGCKNNSEIVTSNKIEKKKIVLLGDQSLDNSLILANTFHK